jgi:hypothetical protein
VQVRGAKVTAISLEQTPLVEGAFVPVGGPYKFETADGRTGQIHVRRNATGSQKATQVDFNGTGRFA